jgi:hypothetical protein
MASWEGFFRSNYFKVKDFDKFKEFINSIDACNDVDIFTKVLPDGTSLYGVGDYGGLPQFYDKDANPDLPVAEEEYAEADVDGFLFALSKHLEPGQVAVFHEVGFEKLRYLTGAAVVVTSDGRTCWLHLGDIVEKAEQELGISMLNVTDPSY